MAKYPLQNFQVFSRMFDVGQLKPLVQVLNDPMGSAQKVTTAISQLPPNEQKKNEAAIDYVRWTYPGLATVISSQSLLAAITRPGSLDGQIQTALDGLTPAEAHNSRAGIELLLSRRKKLSYIQVASLTAGFQGSLTPSIQGQSVRYTSKAFMASAKIYAITQPGTHFDIGWIQICTGRTQRHDFADGSLNSRWEIANPFPINDSSSVGNIPWYHVGVGYGCTHNTAARNVTLSGESSYDLNDGFVNNGIGIWQNYSDQNQAKRSILRQISRKQTFEAWLAVTPHGTRDYRLLRKVAYEFDFTVTLTVQGKTGSVSGQDTPRTPIVTTPGPNDTLPAAATRPPTMNDGDTLYVYRGDTRLGAQNNTIPTV